jgi:hypothetical protein
LSVGFCIVERLLITADVRRALLRADPATSTVTRLATDHGFWELARFSVAHHALFGEVALGIVAAFAGTQDICTAAQDRFSKQLTSRSLVDANIF